EAHANGSASLAYRDAVRHSDAVVARIWARLNPTRDALVVSSDHGHIARGGHGGDEVETVRIPIVLWGAGVRPERTRGHADGRDVGPSIVALLGLPPLAHARGRSLIGESPAAVDRRTQIEQTLASWQSGRPGRLLHARASALAVLLLAAGVLG